MALFFAHSHHRIRLPFRGPDRSCDHGHWSHGARSNPWGPRCFIARSHRHDPGRCPDHRARVCGGHRSRVFTHYGCCYSRRILPTALLYVLRHHARDCWNCLPTDAEFWHCLDPAAQSAGVNINCFLVLFDCHRDRSCRRDIGGMRLLGNRWPKCGSVAKRSGTMTDDDT
jgi:hypothetical protein